MAQPYGRTGSLTLSLFKKSSSDLKMLGRMAKQKERRFDFYCFVGVTRNGEVYATVGPILDSLPSTAT